MNHEQDLDVQFVVYSCAFGAMVRNCELMVVGDNTAWVRRKPATGANAFDFIFYEDHGDWYAFEHKILTPAETGNLGEALPGRVSRRAPVKKVFLEMTLIFPEQHEMGCVKMV